MPSQPITLSNGTTILVDVASDGPVKKSSVLESLQLQPVVAQLEGLTQDLKSALVAARPDRTKLELALDLSVKEGKGLSLFLRGDAKASIKITCEWDKPASAQEIKDAS